MLKACCCCIPVKTGAYILGSLLLISLTEEFKELFPFRSLINLFTSAMFLMMVFQDTERARKNFFWSWTLLQGITLVFVHYNIAIDKIEESGAAKLAC